MDHHEEHHLHHRKEREERKRHEHELREEKQGSAIHPLWFLVLGVVVTLGAVLTWMLI